MMRVFLSLFLFITINLASVIGATKGEFSVNQGSASYDLEIVTPKGVAGLKPKLSISYNSSNTRNGLVGEGFSINGLSVISKCNQTLFADKLDSSRTYNYCLDGQKLVLKDNSQSYGSNTEYKTKIDSYSKIIKYSNYWLVYTKDGLIYEYGRTSDSNNSNITFKVNKISDRYANKIIFEYDTSSKSIKKIKYAEKANSNSYINIVDFIYEDRKDKRVLYSKGVKYNLDKRLEKIKISINGVEESNYQFDYNSKNFTQLYSITECVSNSCLKPIIFNYENNNKHFSSNDYSLDSYILQKDSTGTKKMLLDMNGDGLVDKLKVSSSKLYVALNNGAGFDSYKQWEDPKPNFSSGNITLENEYEVGRKLMDINSDGLPDKVYTTWTYIYSKNVFMMIQLNTGKGFKKPQKLFSASCLFMYYPWGEYFTYNAPMKVFWDKHNTTHDTFDINGDGYMDRVRINSRYFDKDNVGKLSYTDKKNNITYTHFDKSQNYRYIQASNSNGIRQQFIDMNADGLPDRVINYNYLTRKKGLHVALNNGAGFDGFTLWDDRAESEPNFYILRKNSSGVYSQLLDINGDGLPDRVQHKNYKTNEKGLFVSLNTGKGFAPFENWFEGFSFSNEKDYYLTKESSNSSAAYVYKTFADVDSNGLVDIVFGKDVYFNNGKKFIKKSNFFSGSSSYVSKSVSSGSVASLLDINGDGFLEKVEVKGSSTTIYQGSYNTRYTITSITNYKNEDIDIEYSNLKDEDIYTSTEDLEYPNRNIKASTMKVVKSFSVDNGVGGKNKTSFKYEDFAINLERGSLGFKKITTKDETTNTKSTTTYNQEYPYIGIVKTNESFVNERKISESENKYKNISRGDYLQIYLEQTIEKSYDYDTNDELITKTTLNSNIDEYGNIKNISTITQGKGETFTKEVINNYTNDENNWILSRLTDSTVTHKASGKVNITRKSSFEYDPIYGTLIKEVIEPNKTNSLTKTYSYPANYKGNKASETISGTGISSRTTKFKYDENYINLVEIENALGHKEYRNYNNKNQLIDVSGPNALHTKFSYDEMGRKIKEIKQGIPNNIISTWDYSWHSSGHKVVQKTQDKFPVTVYYDSLSREIKKEKVGFDGRTIIEETKYDKKGNKEYITTAYFQDETPEYIYYKYDEINRLYEVDYPSVHGRRVTDTIKYSPFETQKTNAKGQIKTTRVNALGKVSHIDDGSTIDYSYYATGDLKSTTDEAGNVTTIEYDVFGNKIKQIDPDMGTWTYTYYSTGELKSQKDAKNQTTSYSYDKLGRIINKTTPEGTITFVYDTASGKGIGQVHKEIGIGITKEYSYDTLGRLSNLNTIIGNTTYTQSYTYDNLGRLEKRVEPNNITFTNKYNENGYLEAVTSPKFNATSSDIDILKEELSYTLSEYLKNKQTYLTLQRKITEYETNLIKYKAIVDIYENENHGEHDYDRAEVLEELRSYVSSLEEFIEIMRKLADGYEEIFPVWDEDFYENLLFMIGLNYEFWNEIIEPDSQLVSIDEDISYYIGKGDEGYGPLTAIASDAYYIADLLENGDDLLYYGSDSEIYAYYEQKIALLESEVSDLQKLKEQKDAAKKLRDYHDSKNNALGELLNSDEIYFYKVLEKNSYGVTTSYLSGNGLTTRKEFDENGILYSINTGYDSGETIRDLSFEYDDLMNVITREDKKLGTNQAYVYDDFNRLDYYTHTDKNANDTLINYNYDQIGNIIYKTGLGNYEYNSSRPHAVTKVGSKSYTYDANGNMTNNNGRSISYTSFNKPSKISKSGKYVNFYYDANNKRYKKQSNGLDTYYIGKGYEEIKSGVFTKKRKYFIYAEGKLVSEFVEKDTKYSVKYMHYDNLGSIDTVTNGLGVVTERFAYKPFGEKLNLDKYGDETSLITPSTNRGYTGHEHIDEFNLIHMNGRVYDPIIGKFLSADPHIQDSKDSQSYNRYSYVRNNPLKYTDPSGYSWFSKLWKKVKKWIKPIVAIAVAAVITYFTVGGGTGWLASFWAETFGTGLGATVAAGATAGFASGLIMTGSLKGALKGAVFGGLSAGIANEIGGFVKGLDFTATTKAGIRAVLHGITRSAITKVQGGRWSSGFWSGFASSLFAPIVGKYFKKAHVSVQSVISGVIAGTVSVISGGKFANGAVTGAFTYLFNFKLHEAEQQALEAKKNGIELSVVNDGSGKEGWIAVPPEQAAMIRAELDPWKGIDSSCLDNFACTVLKGAQEGSSLRYIFGTGGAIVGPGFGIIRKSKQYYDRKHPKR